MTRPCGDPSCRCHIADRTGQGWRFGNEEHIYVHGEYVTYTMGCRCPDCKRASTQYQRARRARQSQEVNA